MRADDGGPWPFGFGRRDDYATTGPVRCDLPPLGWTCTLDAGHDGPCPTVRSKATPDAPMPSSLHDVVKESGVPVVPSVHDRLERAERLLVDVERRVRREGRVTWLLLGTYIVVLVATGVGRWLA